MAERLSPPVTNELLTKAFDSKRKKEEEKKSIEEAKQRVPELERRILELLEIGIPKPLTSEEEQEMTERLQRKAQTPRKISSEEMEGIIERVQKNLTSQFKPTTAKFEVPVRDGAVSVTLSKGARSNSYQRRVDSSLEVDVIDLDHVLRIDNGRAVVESKIHKQKPFDMHTPIGPGGNSDLGPVWSREMNMEDFENYNSLLDRLLESDVARTEIQ